MQWRECRQGWKEHRCDEHLGEAQGEEDEGGVDRQSGQKSYVAWRGMDICRMNTLEGEMADVGGETRIRKIRSNKRGRGGAGLGRWAKIQNSLVLTNTPALACARLPRVNKHNTHTNLMSSCFMMPIGTS